MNRLYFACLLLAVAVSAGFAAPRGPDPVVPATIGDLIAQPWKYHNKTVRVAGVLRYVFAGRGSRWHIGADRSNNDLIDVDSDEPEAMPLLLRRYSWAKLELIARFDGECAIPRGDGMMVVCADGGGHGYLIPKAVSVLGYVEPVIESRRTIELREIDPRSAEGDGVIAFVQTFARAIAERNINALEAMNEPRLDPVPPEDVQRERALLEDYFLAGDMQIFNAQSPEPFRDYRLYHEDGYTLRSVGDDYLCFCKQASCAGRWPRPGEIFNGNPTRPWVCYPVIRENGRWYFE